MNNTGDMRRWGISVLVFWSVGMGAYSQEVPVAESDSVPLSQMHMAHEYDGVVSGYSTAGPGFDSVGSPYGTAYSILNRPNYYGYGQSQAFDANEVPVFSFNPQTTVPHLGNLSGYVYQESLPGLMGIESGALSYGLQAGALSFTPAVYVNKYGYYGGLTTSLGVGGELNLRINNRFSITAFGTYHSNAWAANPAVMSNMMSSRFGGYGTWNINDKWSLNVGAQRIYNSATGQWQTIPIVMPSFKINGKNAVSIDLGGVLYQMVDWQRNKNWQGRVNPTIGPPVSPQITFPPRD